MSDPPFSFARGGYSVSLNPEAQFADSTVLARWRFHIYRKGEIEPNRALLIRPKPPRQMHAPLRRDLSA